MTSRVRLLGMTLSVGCLALLPLAVWPGIERPFSVPKVWVAVFAVVVSGTCLLLGRRDDARAPSVPASLWWLAAGWMASFILAALAADLPSFEATLLGIVAPLFAITLVGTGAPPERVAEAQAAGVGLAAVVALAQWVGVDPFAWFGWHAPIEGASVRMRVYATLGNPNFVGALMAMSLPIAGARLLMASAPAARLLTAAAVVAQAGALLATGSRGAVLGLAAGVLAWASVRWSARAVAGLAAVFVFAGAAIAISPARPLQTTIAGRVYLWQVVAPFATERLATGYGPGALELRFPAWQRAAAARGVVDPRFAGLTDHAHNDYLEALVERGLPGLVTLLLPIATMSTVIRRRRRPTSPLLAGSWAAVVAGAACALVDFPLARPAELIWWWTAIAQVHRVAAAPAASAPPSA